MRSTVKVDLLTLRALKPYFWQMFFDEYIPQLNALFIVAPIKHQIGTQWNCDS